ncbi:alpha/beta hydrolase [Phanerochaete sordida]|uniref:Protein phosphatase methylesterase 1 n=1 Tax=Phanerochaete sordida TaxID=48140 RepID=A0A9P3FYM8_9APHY|nr:alpha/beta hydrolase [Phanerochaete sordida]
MAPPSSRSSRTRGPNPAFTPISAAGYFEQALQVAVPESGLEFRVYYTAPKAEDGAVMVCHHGAGWSALTFACFAKEVTRQSKGECGVLALDMRGHGKTTSQAQTPADKEDLSIDTLTTDLVNLISNIFKDPASTPTLLLVGHSLGGSVITRASPLLQERKYRIGGVAVLDVVEEFTLEALPMMNSLLDSRPEGFNSQEEAIEWHLNTHAIRNPDSARVSVPSIIKENPHPAANSFPWVWRTSLRATAPYWTSWFTGLSQRFLSAKTARLLVLAGTERLDKELMIGQMTGKYQLVVIPNVGHILHEDDPQHLAEVLVEFWRRNERLTVNIKNLKKVGEA